MRIFLCIFLLISLTPSYEIHLRDHPYLIIWNVGQGQWITWKTSRYCIHFDMGGEFMDWSKLKKNCAKKENLALFSHWDWDHIRFAKIAQRKLRSLCIVQKPNGPTHKKRQKFLSQISLCPQKIPQLKTLSWNSLFSPSHSHLFRASPRKSTNAFSHISILKDKVLLPGDSPRREELRWLTQIPFPKKINLLILGHHGSQTSTSQELLNHLPKLQLAIASARHSRFGHPHKKIINRCQKRGISLLKTELWNHIFIEL